MDIVTQVGGAVKSLKRPTRVFVSARGKGRTIWARQAKSPGGFRTYGTGFRAKSRQAWPPSADARLPYSLTEAGRAELEQAEILDLLAGWDDVLPARPCPHCGEVVAQATPGEPCGRCQAMIAREYFEPERCPECGGRGQVPNVCGHAEEWRGCPVCWEEWDR